MNYEIRKDFLLLFFILNSLFLIHVASAATSDDLKNKINAKTQALQELNQQILKTNQELEDIGEKEETLEREIRRIDYTINQLNLNIQASEVTIDKLQLEIESLGYQIEGIQDDIVDKKVGVAVLLNELYKKDDENALSRFLRQKSLAAGFAELQELVDFNSRFSIEISELVTLHDDLTENRQQTKVKKSDVEQERVNLASRKVIVKNQQVEQKALLLETKNQEKLYQEQIAQLEDAQEAIAGEIESLEEELRQTIDPTLLPTPRPGVLGEPADGIITQGYGGTSFALRAYRGQWHNGVDFRGAVGAPVYAAEEGTVREVWDQDKYCYRGAYGKFIVIEHPNNLTTMYAHLSLQSVAKGDTVSRGQVIGYIGRTGYAFGPHLHFTVYAGPTFRIGSSKLNCGPVMPYGGDLDPMDYL